MPTKRTELIDPVLRGEMPPSKAENEAERLGLGPLTTTPDPAGFGPKNKAPWTLLMTLSWIMWRDGDQLILTLKKAKKELWRNLMAEWLSASDTQESTGKKVRIPAKEWCDMQMRCQDGSVKLSFGEKSYSDITLISGDVRTLWKSDANGPPAERKPLDVTSPYDDPMDGWMYLGEVIYWVASEGKSFHPSDQDEAEKAVFVAIDCNRLKVEGKNADGEPEPIPGSYFSNVITTGPSEWRPFFSQIDRDPNSDIDDPDARIEFGGTLTLAGKDKPKWTNIRCKKESVINIWPKSLWSATTGPKSRPSDAGLAERIEAVIAEARPRKGKQSYRQMAALICKDDGGKFENFSQNTVIKILTDKYGPMERLGIKANISAKDRVAKK